MRDGYAAIVSPPTPRAGLVARTASAVGVALVSADLGGLTADEVEIADAAVVRGVGALPDSTRLGVDVAATLVRTTLDAAARGRFLALDPGAQRRVVQVLTRRPLPVVAEFVKLTRGLALVAVVDHRHRAGAMG